MDEVSPGHEALGLVRLDYRAVCVTPAGALGETVCGRGTYYEYDGDPICAGCRKARGL